jgi:riboflavin biosynthesis pyrimidine reductase
MDLRRALTALGERGMRHALVEGGPGLNAQLAHARLLDELCLTLSPRVVAGDGPRILAGPELSQPLEPRVIQLLEDNGFLFLRMACI